MENNKNTGTFQEWYRETLATIKPEDYLHVLENLPECLTDMSRSLHSYKEYGKRAHNFWLCLSYMRNRIMDESGRQHINHLAKIVKDQKEKTGLFAYGEKVHVPEHYAQFLKHNSIIARPHDPNKKMLDASAMMELFKGFMQGRFDPEKVKKLKITESDRTSVEIQMYGPDKRSETSANNGGKGGRPCGLYPSPHAMYMRLARAKKKSQTSNPKTTIYGGLSDKQTL